MANILNIDTSSNLCSVALSRGGEIILGYESSQKMDHSVTLAPFVEKCLNFLKERNEILDCVSVTSGPGSYTGLRIGLSLAKGIAYGFSIPLITLSSLEVMAVRAIFSYPEFNGDEVIVPMIDARRMEVYTGVFDSKLDLIGNEKALILDDDSFTDLHRYKKVIFIGNGSPKFKNLYKKENALWLGEGMAHAKFMTSLSEKYFKESRFSNVAYSIPNYLKDYLTTKPKNKL